MNILFIIPSLRLGSANKQFPVGITSVMTFVQERGYQFDVLDIDINDYSDEYVENYLATHTYDVILTGCIVTHYKWVKWLCRTIKKYNSKTKIVVGNSVAGSIPETFLPNTGADVAVIGEGEYTVAELLDCYRDGKSIDKVESIAYLDATGTLIKTPKRKACDINELPMINWDLLDTEKYFSRSVYESKGLEFDETNKPRVMPISTARGCVFKCTFCHYVFWNDPYRHRTAESILKEAKRNIEKYKATYMNFWDDLSFSSLQQAEKIADGIIESGLKFNWSGAVRCDLLGNPQFPYERRLRVAKKMKESGCVLVVFSLESGNEEILTMMNKKIQSEYFHEQIRVCREAGINVATSVVFGYPIETPETIRETFVQCLKARIYPSIGFLLPLPYTGMYEYAKKHGFITNEDAYLDSITERQDICMNMTKMSNEEIMENIKEGARQLNEMLELGLTDDRLIRTGGYRNHTKETSKGKPSATPPLDPNNLKRNENDVTFNYSQAVFDLDPTAESNKLNC